MHRRIFLPFALSCLVLILAFAGCSPKEEEIVEQSFAKTVKAGTAPRITIRNTDGAIHIYGSRADEVKVEAIKKAYGRDRVEKIAIAVTAGGNSIDIDTTFPPRPKLSLSDRSGTVDYTIIVPEGSTIPRLELTNGEILIKGLRDGAVTAKLVNGRLFDHDSFGAHNLFVANGGVELGWEWWEAGKFAVKAKVVSGTVRALIPRTASFHLQAKAASGKISNAFGDVPDQGKDGSQQLDVAVGARSEALIDLQTTQGNIGITEY